MAVTGSSVTVPPVDYMGNGMMGVIKPSDTVLCRLGSAETVGKQYLMEKRDGTVHSTRPYRLTFTPGERPPSNMAPAVLKSQLKTLVIGGSGGSWITTGMASVIMNHLWFGKSLKEAIDTQVVYVDSQNEAKFELRSEKDVIEVLKAERHKITKFYNVVNAVEKDDGGCISAYSDERKKGKAAGY